MQAFLNAWGRPKPPKLVSLTCQHFGVPRGAQFLRSWQASYGSIFGRQGTPKACKVGRPHMLAFWIAQGAKSLRNSKASHGSIMGRQEAP